MIAKGGFVVRIQLLLAAALGLSVLSLPHDVCADESAEAPAPSLEGTYAPQNPKAAQAVIDNAIESVVQEMNFIKRPFARSRLRDTNPLLTQVRFQRQDDLLIYTYNAGNVIRLVPNGPAIRWKSPADGNTYETKATLVGRRFTLFFKGEEGSKKEVFELGADGTTLTVHSVITSPQLPKALEIRYTIKRK